jgi:Lipase (class 3)
MKVARMKATSESHSDPSKNVAPLPTSSTNKIPEGFRRRNQGGRNNFRCNLSGDAIDEIARGLSYASLAITDDKTNTLRNIARKNPWHVETLKAITGSEEKSHQPLSRILKEDMNLQLDQHIDIVGVTKSGDFLDTQGYIAHNDETIVLAYRCSTSAFDWLANLANVSTTSSTWEIERNEADENFVLFDGMEAFLCGGDDDGSHDRHEDYKPRVSSEFYHNFVASLPLIKRNIEPLLAPDQPPRKLFITGHSMGAGVATLAACYFLLEFDWVLLPHSLVMVTAGSPRSCCWSMKDRIDECRLQLGDSVRLYRVVKGDDALVTLPPSALGFVHIVPKIFIDDEGTIAQEDEVIFDMDGLEVDSHAEDIRRGALLEAISQMPSFRSNPKYLYKKLLVETPKGLRDHMPDS